MTPLLLALGLSAASARERPAVADPAPGAPPVPEALALSDGTPVWVLRVPGAPLVRVEVSLLEGHLHAKDPAALRMAGALLGVAPAGGASAWGERLVSVGGVTSAGAGALRSWQDVEVLAGGLEAAVDLGRDAALGARFPRGEVRRLRRAWRGTGATGWRSGARVLETATARATYPVGHVRARVDGPEAWRGVGPRRVRRAWAEACSAPRAVLVAGDVTPEQVVAVVESAWVGGGPGAPPLEPAPPAREPRLILVDHPGASQALVRASLPAVGVVDPGLPALRVVTELLGGAFSSRLNARLREDLGITYGAGASLSLGTRHGRMLMDTTVAPGDAGLALDELNDALLMLELRPPSAAEVDAARRALRLRAERAAERLDGRSFPHGEALSLGRPPEAVRTDRSAVEHVGLDAVQAAAARIASADDVTWLVVGDADVLEPALAEAGWIPDLLWSGRALVSGLPPD